MSDNTDPRRFNRREYAALARLESNEDFKLILAALERRMHAYMADVVANGDPDRPGKIGQAQGKCKELADILETARSAKQVLQNLK